ncbi:MAG TPA: response regulator [Bacteroidales bacterium]|nr:response regulator [Bacteroidales bacterium]HPS17197.1 response regulator [Bacteroidales bacterium]
MSTDFFKEKKFNNVIIFIVEDNEVYAKSLKTFIQNRFSDIKEIKVFRIGEMCLLELHRNPMIVIMDYFLNSKYEEAYNGLEIIKRIKSLKPQTHIIVLSIQKNIDVILESIKQYDCIYIQKDKEAFAKIEQAIKDIFKNKTEKWN